MLAIYKYILKDWSDKSQETLLTLPRGAIVLTMQEQGDKLVMWARVDPDTVETDTRTFYVAATGEEMNDSIRDFDYKATVQRFDGVVAHLFEVTVKPEWSSKK